MPTPAEVGADPVGAAAAAQAAAVVTANAYTDAAIFAVTSSADRARIATLVTIPDLSSVTLAPLDPALAPAFLVEGDKVLVLGQASPDGVILPSDAYAGLYDVGPMVAGVAALTRNPSYNTAVEICGATWFVTDGTYSNDFWACTNDPTTTILDNTSLAFVQIAGALSNNAAQALGVAASGTSHDVSRADHVHAMPTAGDVGAMVNPMTTEGDLITGGAAGVPGRLGIGANGTVLTVTAGVPAWAAAAGGVDTSFQAAPDTGWTAGGNGTATISAGVATLTMTDSNNTVRLHRTALTSPHMPAIEFVARIRQTVASGVHEQGIALTNAAYTRGVRVQIDIYNNATLYSNVSGSWASGSSAGSVTGWTAGTLWLRMVAAPNFVHFYHGSGAGPSLPTSWTRIASYNFSGSSPDFTSALGDGLTDLVLFANRLGGFGNNQCTAQNIQWRSLLGAPT